MAASSGLLRLILPLRQPDLVILLVGLVLESIDKEILT
jgi:hypothetical protein